MADVAITAANVLASASARRVSFIAGATITQGEAVYIDATGKVQPTLATSTATTANAVGCAENSALSGQPVSVVTFDSNWTPGFTGAIGNVVTTSVNAGQMTVTPGDIGTGNFVCVLGVMKTATTMVLNPSFSGAVHA